jgi:hypothetical protein
MRRIRERLPYEKRLRNVPQKYSMPQKNGVNVGEQYVTAMWNVPKEY